jgi:hypothetical protein
MAPRATRAPVLLAALLSSQEALADHPRARPIQLTYLRGPGASSCPDAATLRRAVEEELGYDPFDDAAARRLVVSIDRRGADLAVEMELQNEAGERVWEERSIRTRSDCRTLVAALGLSITIRIEPEPSPPACPVRPASAPAAPLPAPPAPRPRADPATATGDPESRSPATRGLTPFLQAGLVGAWLTPSAIAPGAAIGGGVRWSWASIALEARVLLPGVGDRQGERIATWFFGGALAPCAHLGPARGCGLIAADVVHFDGADAISDVKTFAQISAGLRAGVGWPITRRFALGARADLLGILSPGWALSLDHGALWYAPSVRGVVAAEVTVLFPPSPSRSTRLRSTSSTKWNEP